MMGEPVEQGAGEPFGAEYGSPFIERQVACDQRGATFIALAEHLEEQFGADSRERRHASAAVVRNGAAAVPKVWRVLIVHHEAQAFCFLWRIVDREGRRSSTASFDPRP